MEAAPASDGRRVGTAGGTLRGHGGDAALPPARPGTDLQGAVLREGPGGGGAPGAGGGSSRLHSESVRRSAQDGDRRARAESLCRTPVRTLEATAPPQKALICRRTHALQTQKRCLFSG